MAVPQPDFTQAVAQLSRAPDIRALALSAFHIVMSARLSALFDRAQREPLAELTQRFRSFEAASAVLALLSEVRTSWPEPFVVNRPCCTGLSPDEFTLAGLVRSALRGDRAGFAGVLDGFIRADRHDRLFDAVAFAATTLEAAKVR